VRGGRGLKGWKRKWVKMWCYAAGEGKKDDADVVLEGCLHLETAVKLLL
jgi:hypothetical protein